MNEIENDNKIPWMLFDDKKIPVSNFDAKVLSVEEVLYPSEKEIVLHIRITFIAGINKEIYILEKDLKSIEWEKVDFRCVVNCLNSSARKFLFNYIRCQLGTCTHYTKIGIENQGLNRINETVVFVAGDTMIIPSNRPDLKDEIRFRPSAFRLDIDKNISIKDAALGMYELICLSPEIGSIVVAHTISALIRSAFRENEISPNSVLVILGESGMLKTSYVSHIVQLYNRKDEIKPVTRFNSTTRFLEDILCEYVECTAVIDDIHTGSSSAVRKNNESNAEELIRRIGDNTGKGYKQGKNNIQKSFNGNAVFIGEYINSKGSSIPRTLVAQITERIDGTILDKYQRRNKLLVSTFYFYFLQWFVDCYKHICKIIGEKFDNQRRSKNEAGLHNRLLETQFYLGTSYAILLEFYRSYNLISNENMIIEINSFNEYINDLAFDQQERYKPQDPKYLSLISSAYKKGLFRIAQNKNEFNCNIHDAVIHYGCLCVCSERFDAVMSKIILNYNHKDVVNYLKAKNALKLHQSDGKNDIKISGLKYRFFSIYLDKIM